MKSDEVDAVDAVSVAAFRLACALDVAVCKPGNVSVDAPGHGMLAEDFLHSAAVAAPSLMRRGASVGERIEAAVEATWAAVGCNTNLGIVLLCAPLAAAAEDLGAAAAGAGTARWADALGQVFNRLDVTDAQAAFRAIARASPGGLGDAPEQDVHAAATVTLREAMALAAHRDRIALQYAQAGAELLRLGLPALVGEGAGEGMATGLMVLPRGEALVLGVQRVWLAWLASGPDSHLVRKHGESVGHSVTDEAQPWVARARLATSRLDRGLHGEAWSAWDARLKTRGWNPGTSADLTVATLFLAGLMAGPEAVSIAASGDLARIV